ncbi:receptor-like protein kinase THESEUS 1 [Macadamia integrifolia]|uniref:receptor-like protein kinase THESEUS 1 n=1 Tax=Macadamia integrifolia TaxID=60698 RepID=UPI001C4ECB26|nr:receptor-like protein kinase THESEUS 1 [Macadamia integrifolia]
MEMVEMETMRWLPLILSVLLVLFNLHGSFAAFSPADNYLIACGSPQNVSFQGRTFAPDSVQSSFVLKGQGNSVAATSSSSVPSPIYQSARIFASTASYKFKIQQEGRHWVRLYFYPLPDSGHNLASATITVITDDFVLLNNFSFESYNSSYLFKEYSINVTSDTLTLTFIPMNNSATFVNGIEVVSVPDVLIPDQALVLFPSSPFNGLSDLSLETVFRLNMGGPLLTPQNDTLGRIWENDMKYLHVNSSAVNVLVNPSTIRYTMSVTSEIAPNWVYATAESMGDPNVPNQNFNVTWVFPVDPNFMYFIRLHFCDIVSRTLYDLVFNAYINSDTAISSLDLSTLTGNLATPYYKDFISNSSIDSDTITVSVGPDTMADITGAILNGLEIMKISNDARSLDGLISVEGLLPKSSKNSKIGIIVGAALGTLATVGLIAFCYCCLIVHRSKTTHQGPSWLPLPLYGNSQTMTKVSTTSQKSGTGSCISLASSNLGRLFMFQEIMDATNRFDESLLLGVGGFGKVYKGTLEDGTEVAVKRGNPRSEQGLAEFRTEIEMLSKLRHRHLVSLIGYCDERSEMILVYEYMANGPLRSHLYGTELPSLSWKQRLEICIGAARGLHYLHTGSAQSIIHRDVKTTNILLDENFVAKVADFGLSKTGPALDQTHVSTAVKGSFGYLDPEYFRRQQLTEKSDVYSFGVVLMEVLCSRPALDPALPREQVNIAEWAMSQQKKGMLDHIIDPTLVGKVINAASLKKFGETAEKCLAEYGVDRPSMGDVLWNLEYALQLEETSLALTEPEDNSTNHIPGIPMTPLDPFDHSASMIDGVNAGTNDDPEDTATSAVFSQLVNPRGR